MRVWLKLNKIIILIGATASGKDTILNEVLKFPNVEPAISVTTRPMREGEQEGKEYYFTNNYKFGNMARNKEFIETRKYIAICNGKSALWQYGMPKSEFIGLENNINKVLIVDYEGYKELKEKLINELNFDPAEVLGIYVQCSVKTRILRSLERNGQNDSDCYEIARRILDDKDKVEIAKDKVDFTLINETKTDLERNISFIKDLLNR